MGIIGRAKVIGSRLLGLLIVLALLLSAPAIWACSPTLPVLSFSDIHFNPFADPGLVRDLAAAPSYAWEGILARSSGQTPSSWGSETNHALLNSFLQDMQKTEDTPAFLLFTGDILAHNFAEHYVSHTGDTSQAGLRSFIKKTVDYVAQKVSSAFAESPVYFTLGNNDAYNGDYRVAPQGAFLREAGSLLADYFLKDQADRRTFLQTFSQGGYYSLALPGDLKTRVIGINSIFFSVNYQDPGESPLDYDPAQRQLAWLAGELARAAAKQEKVWLLSHIPPGINVYNTVHDPANTLEHMVEAPTFWHETYIEQYLSLVRKYVGAIAATLSGHTHMDDFRLVFGGQAAIGPSSFIHINPAISPQFGNNPAFKLFTVNGENLAVSDAAAHRLNLNQPSALWSRSYSFNETYGKSGVNAPTLNWLRNSMTHNEAVQRSYMLHYNADNTASPFKPEELKAFWTGMAQFREQDFLKEYNRNSNPVSLVRQSMAVGW